MKGFRCLRRFCGFVPIGLALLSMPAAATSVLSVENVEVFQETLRHQNTDRRVLFLKPAIPDSNDPAPALVLLHFLDGTPPEMANLTEIALMVRDHGTWVILPEAVSGYWNHTPNAGELLTPLGALDLHVGLYGGSAVDDVGFLTRMIDSMVARHPIDPRRIYMAGYSNGALMSERYACERPDRIAGAGVVGASMRESLQRRCAPSRPVSMLFINGDSDRVSPYAGTIGVLPAPEAAAFWATANGCGATLQRSTLPDIEDDGTLTQLDAWQGCRDDSAVEFYTVINGGHTWPGTLDYTPALGRASQDFSATQLLWEFFSRFSR